MNIRNLPMQGEDEVSPTNPCITPECGKERQWKGLCRSCYSQARKLIGDKKTTWEELSELGMIITDAKPFTALFLRKKRHLHESETNEGSPPPPRPK